MAAQEGIITIPISAQLTSNGYGGVADAEQIAYSYKTENDITQIDKSIKDKIDEIEQSVNTEQIQNIVDQKIQTLDIPSTEDLNTATTNAQNAATQAQGYSADASSNRSKTEEAFNKIRYGYLIDENRNIVAVPDDNGTYHGIGTYSGRDPYQNEGWKIRDNNNNVISCSEVKSVSEYTEQLDRISEVAETFATGFDVDAQFVIISELEYNALVNKNDNTIYFIY